MSATIQRRKRQVSAVSQSDSEPGTAKTSDGDPPEITLRLVNNDLKILWHRDGQHKLSWNSRVQLVQIKLQRTAAINFDGEEQKAAQSTLGKLLLQRKLDEDEKPSFLFEIKATGINLCIYTCEESCSGCSKSFAVNLAHRVKDLKQERTKLPPPLEWPQEQHDPVQIFTLWMGECTLYSYPSVTFSSSSPEDLEQMRHRQQDCAQCMREEVMEEVASDLSLARKVRKSLAQFFGSGYSKLAEGASPAEPNLQRQDASVALPPEDIFELEVSPMEADDWPRVLPDGMEPK